MRAIVDVFNMMNANTALVRVNNIDFADVQRAGAEPEPAHRPRRSGGRVLV